MSVANTQKRGLTSRVLVLGAFQTLTTMGFSLVLANIASILIVRSLGVTGRGEVAEAVLIPTILGYVGILGIPVACGFLISSSHFPRQAVIANARAIAVLLSLILLGINVFLIALFPLNGSLIAASLVFSFFIPLNFLVTLHQTILQTDFRTEALNFVKLVGSVSYVLILAGLYLSGHSTPTAVIISQLIAYLLWLITTMFFVRDRPLFGWDKHIVRPLASYGVKAHLGSVSPVDTLRLDQLLLALFLSTHDLGIYVVAMTFVTANRMVGVSLGMLAFPVAANRTTPVRRKTSILGAFFLATLVLSIILAVVQSLYTKELLAHIFGVTDSQTIDIVPILVFASIFLNLRQVTSDAFRGLGQPLIPSLSEIVSVTSLVSFALFLRHDGLEGIARAVAIAAIVALAAQIAFFSLATRSNFLRDPQQELGHIPHIGQRIPKLKLEYENSRMFVILGVVITCAISGVFLERLSLLIAASAAVLLLVALGGTILAARIGIRSLVTAGLFAYGATLAMTRIRLSPSVALSDSFLVVSSCLLILTFLIGKEKRERMPNYLIVGTLAIGFGGFVASLGASNPSASLANLIRFLTASTFVPLIFHLWTPALSEIRWVTRLWVISASISVAASPIIGSDFRERAQGLTSHPNHLALISVMALGPALGIALSEKNKARWIAAVCSGTLAVGVLISGSRAGLIGVVVVAIIMLVITRERALFFAFVVSAAFAIGLIASGTVHVSSGNALSRIFASDVSQRASDVDLSDEERTARLEESISLALHHPITGVGFEGARYSHNIYLQIWLSSGVIGLAGLLCVMKLTLDPLKSIRSLSHDKEVRQHQLLLVGLSAGFAGYLVTGLFHNAIWDRFIWTLPALILCQKAAMIRAGAIAATLDPAKQPIPARHLGRLRVEPRPIQ